MDLTGLCKGCSDSVIVTDFILEDMIEAAVQSGKKTVSDEVYEKRLRECNQCPSLQYGTTCMHSGSLVAYRAKFIDGTCPAPTGSKW